MQVKVTLLDVLVTVVRPRAHRLLVRLRRKSRKMLTAEIIFFSYATRVPAKTNNKSNDKKKPPELPVPYSSRELADRVGQVS